MIHQGHVAKPKAYDRRSGGESLDGVREADRQPEGIGIRVGVSDERVGRDRGRRPVDASELGVAMLVPDSGRPLRGP